MASRGLLGALGGLGAGISQFASTMFNVQIEKDREARLQAIADKNYDRSRADQLADLKSQREFQTGLLKDERAYQDQVRSTEFGQQVALQTLGEGVQRRLLAEAQKYPQSPLGKLLQDRNNASDPDEIAAINRQIAMSQLITTTDPMGAVTYATAEFGENNEITSLTELGTFGGLGGSTYRPSSDSSSPEAPEAPPSIRDLDAPAVQSAINQIESALESGDLRGATRPQLESRLQELRRRLEQLNSQAANPGYTAFAESFARR
jgi:hypothetical protein